MVYIIIGGIGTQQNTLEWITIQEQEYLHRNTVNSDIFAMLLSLQKLPQDMFFKKKPCIYHYLNAEFLEIAIIILAHSSFVKLLQIINAHKHL